MEIDGKNHCEHVFEFDNNRQKYLKTVAIAELRFDDLELKKNILRGEFSRINTSGNSIF